MDRSKFRIFLTLYRLISLFFRGKIDSFSNFQISSVFYIILELEKLLSAIIGKGCKIDFFRGILEDYKDRL